MWAEWPVVVGAGTLVILFAGFYLNTTRQFLTKDEHQEFKQQILATIERFQAGQEKRVTTEHFDNAMEGVQRSVDKAEKALENRIDDLKFMIAEFLPRRKDLNPKGD